MTGTHLIIDISNILDNEKLKYSSTIFPIMDKIVEQFQRYSICLSSHMINKYFLEFQCLTNFYLFGAVLHFLMNYTVKTMCVDLAESSWHCLTVYHDRNSQD